MTFPKPSQFRFSIDRGGTFTDVYAEFTNADGTQDHRELKLLSEDPEHYQDAPHEGIHRIMKSVTGKAIRSNGITNSNNIEWIRMGTTVATNALLERKGARTALLITKGFGDLLQIGSQNRPHLFDLEIKKPELLYESIIEVDERVRYTTPDETNELSKAHPHIVSHPLWDKTLLIEQKPDLGLIRSKLEEIYHTGIRSLAIVLMHATLFPDHEQQIAQLAHTIGFTQISISSDIMPMIKIVPRGDTTLIDAYLTPHIKNYLTQFQNAFSDQLQKTPLLFMQSDGGLTSASNFTGCRAILSGPAGGVVGVAATSPPNKPVIGFDMGGTSTDVSRYDGEYERVHETEIAGVRVQAPQLNIVTVAAGGGSRLFYENGLFKAGPESAGSHPGPVCYRKNGHLAVTDANLVLGRLLPDYFPKVFGPSANESLSSEASLAAFEKMLKKLTQDHKVNRSGTEPTAKKINEINTKKSTNLTTSISIEKIALGFIKVTNEAMARPMREISVARGYDIKKHVLSCFGGAGGQHACALASILGISEIFIHRFSGILSAYGMGLANVAAERQCPTSLGLSTTSPEQLNSVFEELKAETIISLKNQGFENKTITHQTFLNLRYTGTDTAFMISIPQTNGNPNPQSNLQDHKNAALKLQNYEAIFRERYLREFGFDLKDRDIIIDDIRVRSVAASSTLSRFSIHPQTDSTPPVPETISQTYFEGGWQKTPVFLLDRLGAGCRIQGPAIIIQDSSTIIIEPDWAASVTEFGDLHIVNHSPSQKDNSHPLENNTDADPVQLSIFSNLFMSIAEQMGRTLQRTAISTNIKERHDFSCAVFDAEGGLVANAPHQPVHLGAMSEAVRKQFELHKKSLKAGDVLVTNHPLTGGSHLPDITVITPILNSNKTPLFFVANRGHHADIGGISPGSMPPFSTNLAEEGACIKSFKLVENGAFQEGGIVKLLKGSRCLSDNISDLKAQVAANQKGIELLNEMIEQQSLELVQQYMKHIQNNAEAVVRSALKDLSQRQGTHLKAEDQLDDGHRIALSLSIDPLKGEAVFDFTESDDQMQSNCNAPRAVTHSAVLYALRCLVNQDIPLNSGCLIPVKILLREGSLLAPSEEAAVVGGNVLTSQRIVDVVLKAFRVAAASQGCMNNLTFGNSAFGYYETIGGGAGAGPTWSGQSGVHTHMTNTRITDPEILEKRYPVILREFALRNGSGGAGAFAGGDGLIRDIEFQAPMNVAILSERRSCAPYGMEGGQPGQCGVNTLIKKKTITNLGGKAEFKALPGDRIRIQTPGGGGWGASKKKL